PAAPAIAVDPLGFAYIFWPDQARVPQRLAFATYNNLFGISAVQQVTVAVPANAQLGITAAIDSRGALHLAWLASGPGVNEIHYQRRFRFGGISIADTVIESRGELIQ